MTRNVLDMLAKSTFSIASKKYVYAKVKTIPTPAGHFLISQDSDEITVVTEVANLSTLDVEEKNDTLWRLISLNLFTPFMAGTLAAVNTACAKAGLNNLVVSTYSKDYILVKDPQLEQISQVLKQLGLQEKTV